MTGKAKIDALDALIAAVEAGGRGVTNWRDFVCLPMGDADNPNPILAHRAYHGSLDAALALHNSLMPERAAIGITFGGEYGATATIPPTWDQFSIAESNLSPARAWLLATLKAYRAQVAG